ncbi:MAG: peroxisomal membrane protein pex14 [Thelocarpon impressellum]|nr:MAG: peroxisomal membrane protein pex14 [Thelocarpon impressellum]
MIREDLVSSAVTFLQDPGVAGSPLDKRIAFLQSKNLTKGEVEAALARAGEDPSAVGSVAASPSPPTTSNYAHQNQQMMRQPGAGAYPGGGYQGGYWQPAPPPELPRRDWRDWFIMATVMSGVSYGLFVVAKRYIYPLVAPPTAPQLAQDKASIDESFAKAFALLDQLSTDTEALKTSEQARTEHVDRALAEVESVIGELKTANRRREDEARRIGDDVRGLKDLIPRAMEAHKDATDARLKELNTELRSLKTLVGNRMAPPPAAVNGDGPALGRSASPAVSTSAAAPARKDSPSIQPNRAAIPAWQMAAAAKSNPSNPLGTGSSNGTGAAQEAAAAP